VNAAFASIAAGQVVSVPTDTVYGLACDAFCREAVERIYEIKGRSRQKPLVLFVGRVEQALEYGEAPEAVHRLMQRLWPGPVTFVCLAGDSAPPWTAFGGTVGLRIPNHPVPLELANRLGTALATTSANLSGRPPALTAAEVAAMLSEEVALIVDGGAAALGRASTVLDVTGARPRILREGAGAREVLRAIEDLWPR